MQYYPGWNKKLCDMLLKVNVNQADRLGKHCDLKATSHTRAGGKEGGGKRPLSALDSPLEPSVQSAGQ